MYMHIVLVYYTQLFVAIRYIYLQDSNNNNMNMALELFVLHPLIARTVWNSQSEESN